MGWDDVSGETKDRFARDHDACTHAWRQNRDDAGKEAKKRERGVDVGENETKKSCSHLRQRVRSRCARNLSGSLGPLSSGLFPASVSPVSLFRFTHFTSSLLTSPQPGFVNCCPSGECAIGVSLASTRNLTHVFSFGPRVDFDQLVHTCSTPTQTSAHQPSHPCNHVWNRLRRPLEDAQRRDCHLDVSRSLATANSPDRNR